jgi:hypothetical protein
MVDYTIVLTHKYAGQEWVLNGDDYDGLTWLANTNKPTKKELDDLWPIVLAEIEDAKNAKIQAKAALLERLGITQDEAKLLIG